MGELKVMTIVGTRPEIIRLSRVIPALDRWVSHTLVHTGQNYEFELNQVFFQDLELRLPDVYLNVDTSTLGSTLGGIITKIEGILIQNRPDAVLILGDTNSSIAGIMVKRLRIPLYHMEAGNRSFDANIPEEINRVLIDHISDFNLCYTEHARRHLLSEGLPHRRIYLTGSPMKEVLEYYRDRISCSDILDKMELERESYILVSMHRAENVDDADTLMNWLDVLRWVRDVHGKRILVSTHPRTRNRLEALGDIRGLDGFEFAKPFSFTDYNMLQMNSYCVLSDSGTITEECSILNFPAVTIRSSMERPEGLDCGVIILTGSDREIAAQAVAVAREMREGGRRLSVPHEYEVENVSQRVVNLVLGTCRLSNLWSGVRA